MMERVVRNWCFCLLSMILPFSLSAQSSYVLSGRVQDASSREAVIDAAIWVGRVL